MLTTESKYTMYGTQNFKPLQNIIARLNPKDKFVMD